jgi:excisionase family DNA binding protein
MQIDLEKKDIEAISEKVVERLRPLIKANGKGGDNTIFDPQGLAQYLRVDVSWIYKQVGLGGIPFFKAGKYTRFKKSAIDKWIERQSVEPTTPVRLPRW